MIDEATTRADVAELLNLSEELGRQMQAGNHHAWLELHLSVPQLKILHILVMSAPQSPSALASVLRVSPATVTGLCDGLVERGYALREANPDDRRSNLVVATPQGQRLVADLVTTHRGLMTKVLEELTERERAVVAEALQLLLEAARRSAREESGRR